MELYKDEPYKEEFKFGDITGAVSKPIGAVAGAAGSGIVALVEPILKAFVSAVGKLFGDWWVTVQYFVLYLVFIAALIFVLVVVFRLEFGAGAMARAQMLAKVA